MPCRRWWRWWWLWWRPRNFGWFIPVGFPSDGYMQKDMHECVITVALTTVYWGWWLLGMKDGSTISTQKQNDRSMKWHHKTCPEEEEARTVPLAGSVMGTLCWNAEGAYWGNHQCDFLCLDAQKLWHALVENCLMGKIVILQHDCAQPDTAYLMETFIKNTLTPPHSDWTWSPLSAACLGSSKITWEALWEWHSPGRWSYLDVKFCNGVLLQQDL
jgi:hypothetical protein